jgi:cell fate regulator YaaT (PSP1 superfamily)
VSNINLDPQQDKSNFTSISPAAEKNYGLFESLIVEKLFTKYYNINGCATCSACYDYKLQIDKREIVEVSCSGLLYGCYVLVPEGFEEKIYPEDFILVQQEESVEIAQVKLIGDLVRLKRNYLGLNGEELPKLVRKANVDDLERVRKNLVEEERAKPIFLKAIEKFKLVMKLVSIHYQFDRKKLFFFYTADGRVDFRELAKELASEFKTRIELRQIGVRDESKKIGGIGTCGREYCCITFLSNFKKITAQLASDQNLLSSMGKLSGPCGKLKCCLSFEMD